MTRDCVSQPTSSVSICQSISIITRVTGVPHSLSMILISTLWLSARRKEVDVPEIESTVAHRSTQRKTRQEEAKKKKKGGWDSGECPKQRIKLMERRLSACVIRISPSLLQAHSQLFAYNERL